jgi:hypothetical protein
LLALWLYATSEGIGSARALARLCESHDVYRWLCGGVSVNYHGLADFRTAHPDLLDRLLSENVASLAVAGVIDLDEVAQDGVRVRAAAGTKSFRRRKKLHKELKKAQRLIERLKQETTDDPQASNRRIMAAKERAAREQEARVKAALDKLAEIEAQRERRSKTNKKQVEKQSEPRASTTDPEARVMKMADGGFRPAYNCQIASAPRWSTLSGNARPEPRMSEVATVALPKLDHRSADLHARVGELDLRAAAFQRHRRRALDLDLRLALDRHVLAVDLKWLGRLQRRLAGGFVRPVLLVLLLHVVSNLDQQLAAARQREVLLGRSPYLLVAAYHERAVLSVLQVVTRRVLSVEQ